MFILSIGAIVIMLNFAMGQFLRAEGAVKEAMVGMLIGTIGNIVLDPILIFTFNMEIKGAALATVLSNLLGLIYYLISYYGIRYSHG